MVFTCWLRRSSLATGPHDRGWNLCGEDVVNDTAKTIGQREDDMQSWKPAKIAGLCLIVLGGLSACSGSGSQDLVGPDTSEILFDSGSGSSGSGLVWLRLGQPHSNRSAFEPDHRSGRERSRQV